MLLGHHTKLTHTKFCDKICHILRVIGKNECARHYKSGFSICNNVYHIQCSKISKNTYRNSSFTQWMCSECTNNFPFNNIICDKDFINTIKCCIHNYHRDLIFNPFDDSDISYNLPMDEIDPDQFYYNSLLQNKCNSNYLYDSEFNQMFSDKFISMYHIHIRSIVKNQDELLIYLHSLKCSFNVIVITENWLNIKTRDTPFLAGYQHECIQFNSTYFMNKTCTKVLTNLYVP